MVNLEAALDYLHRGWSIIPLKRTDGNPEHRKEASGSWSAYQNDRPNEGLVRRWFGKKHEFGIALVLGDVSGGIVCRDFDRLQAYRNWSEAFPELARTLPTVATGDDGRHVYCRSNSSIGELRSQGRLSGNAYFDLGDGECRIDRCYCALPPTMHPNGKRYFWLNPPSGGVPQIDFLEAGFRRVWDVTERDREEQRQLKTTECREVIGEGILPPSLTGGSEIASKGGQLREGSPLVNGSSERLADREGRIQAAILETLPHEEGQRNRRIFELARSLKAIPEIAESKPGDLREIIQLWHTLAKPVIQTQPFESSWIDFIRSWKRVKFPKGQEPMSEIIARALAQPMPPEAEWYDAESTRKLVAICRELSRSFPSGVFFLSVRTAGKLIEVSHMQASRLFEMMVADGLLAVVDQGSSKTQKATRFRYLGTH